MKSLGIAILFLFCSKIIFAQNTSVPNTYALVIGVAKYLDPEIPQLQFANRDAAIFADFLQSKAGGSVPKENIKLLVDEAATSGAVNLAITWLTNICGKNDKVYIYFSGHGGLENITMYKNGFLICYNSPYSSYVSSALSIDYLNDIANTISLKKQAKVIMITDACHSGKMTEKVFKGNFLAADQLRKIEKNEIRITSSAANQLSNENADWGGGRGVFSYYLVYGLKGLAIKADSNNISVADITSYLDSSLKNDLLLKHDNTIQVPVVNGDSNFVLFQVDNATLKAAREEITNDTIFQRAMITSSSIAEESTPENYFYKLLQQYKMEFITENFKLDEVAAEDIPFVLIESLSQYEGQISAGKLNELKKSLLASKELLIDFKNNLAAAFDEAGQRVINQYLEGNAAELEKRKYYNSAKNGYDVYPRMFRLALKLISHDNKYYYNNLLVKLHYFSGVAARLKLPAVEKKYWKGLIETALAEQKKALAMEEHASCIYNELGVLYSLKNNTAEAEKYFKIAAARSPNWAIPFSNLANLYIGINRLDKAALYIDTAKNLQPGFTDLYNGYGLIYENDRNLLQAEEAFHKSIKLNSLNYVPFERLGFLNINTGKYAEADSLMFEAATRKKGYTFNEGRVRHAKLPKFDAIEGVNAIIDPSWITSDNMVGHFALGCQAFRDYKLDVAETEFKKVIALEPNSPLAYHYLGRTLFEQNRLQEAELILKMAMKKYMDYEAWEIYSMEVIKEAAAKKMLDSGIHDFFITSYYGQKEDILLLARLYEQWGHYDEAEIYYQHYLQTDLRNEEGYVNLANFYKHIGRFNEAENILKDFYVKYDKGLPQLLEFYKRVTGLFPDNGEWFLKAGLFQYALAQKNPDEYENDIKAIDPFTGEITYAYWQVTKFPMRDPILPRIIPYGTVIPVFKSKLLLKPFTDGIYYFKKALAAFPSFEEKQLADIGVKIGNLYTWQGLPDSAITFFEAALELNPDDAGTRNKLAVTYSKAYRFTEALVQLDSLLKKGQLNLDKELMLARYKLQDGDIKGAGELIFNAEIIDPSNNMQITLLKAALAKETKNFKEAIAIYTGIVEMNPKDSIQLYNIARLYALDGNRKEAWKWLELSLNAGFNYKMVLQNDPAFNSLKKESAWLARFNNWPGKVYFNSDFTKWNYMFSNLEIYSPLLVQ